MDKMKLTNGLSRLEHLIPKAPTEIKNNQNGVQNLKSDEKGSFKDTLENLINDPQLQSNVSEQKDVAKTGELKSLLKFSNHAVERMQSRGIMYNADRLAKLDEAVRKAESKGSKNTLVLMDDSAAIVSVKNNTVVTVMDKHNLKENVFTNIDSTIVI